MAGHPFYETRDWRDRIRRRQLARAPMCQWPGCFRIADTVDHIQPISEGGSKRPQDPGAELERDVQKMPEDFQAAFSLQLGATHKLGDFIVRDLVKKSGGCANESVRQARAQAEEGLVQALRNWRAR